MSERIVIPARISYANIFAPRSINGSDPKYSAAFIIPKADTKTFERIEDAVQRVIDDSQDKLKTRKNLKLPLRDGDEESDLADYADSMFFNASSKTAPGVVDQQVQPILDESEIYSGCYVNVSVTFYAFNVNGNKGVAAGLNNIQLVKAGARLDGCVEAASEFTALNDDEGEEDLLGA